MVLRLTLVFAVALLFFCLRVAPSSAQPSTQRVRIARVTSLNPAPVGRAFFPSLKLMNSFTENVFFESSETGGRLLLEFQKLRIPAILNPGKTGILLVQYEFGDSASPYGITFAISYRSRSAARRRLLNFASLIRFSEQSGLPIVAFENGTERYVLEALSNQDVTYECSGYLQNEDELTEKG